MNAQSRIDRQVAALHAAIAARIRAGDASPLERAKQNLMRWRERFGGALPAAYVEWVELLDGGEVDQILEVMLDDSEDAVRRRSNSPFTGVLSSTERLEIMRRAA
jgi:hypothetical protein